MYGKFLPAYTRPCVRVLVCAHTCMRDAVALIAPTVNVIVCLTTALSGDIIKML